MAGYVCTVAGGKGGVGKTTTAIDIAAVLDAAPGLVVIDEQHRFGVDQRDALRLKGSHPHVLVLTATPIPRTVAMTVFGDLDVSTIRHLPKGRYDLLHRLGTGHNVEVNAGHSCTHQLFGLLNGPLHPNVFDILGIGRIYLGG